MSFMVYQADCLEWMKDRPDGSVDLVFCSPPYEDARTYNMGFNLRGQDYVDWCAERFRECYRISRGLVAWVIEGRTQKAQYTATPLLLAADLHRSGIMLRKPPVFYRFGIPGSGGKEWLRNDYEFIICASKGKLPYANPLACAQPCKYAPGGGFTCRNQKGDRTPVREYKPPKLANPGNVLKYAVGGGLMGHKLAHENEAPFPLGLAEFFVKSFCRPGGTVLDPFCGSGTTLHAAIVNHRNAIGIDVRPCQVELTTNRCADVIQRN